MFLIWLEWLTSFMHTGVHQLFPALHCWPWYPYQKVSNTLICLLIWTSKNSLVNDQELLESAFVWMAFMYYSFMWVEAIFFARWQYPRASNFMSSIRNVWSECPLGVIQCYPAMPVWKTCVTTIRLFYWSCTKVLTQYLSEDPYGRDY